MPRKPSKITRIASSLFARRKKFARVTQEVRHEVRCWFKYQRKKKRNRRIQEIWTRGNGSRERCNDVASIVERGWKNTETYIVNQAKISAVTLARAKRERERKRSFGQAPIQHEGVHGQENESRCFPPRNHFYLFEIFEASIRRREYYGKYYGIFFEHLWRPLFFFF